MARYTFYCPVCDRRGEVSADITVGPEAPVCHGVEMRRDYRADSPRLGLADLKKELHSGFHPNMVLPTAEELATPDDPDGSKGIREWNERFEPKEGNKHPLRPKALHDKAVF